MALVYDISAKNADYFWKKNLDGNHAVIKLRILLTVIISQLLNSCVSTPVELNPPNTTSGRLFFESCANSSEPTFPLKSAVIKSSSGFCTEFVKLPGEGKGMTVIWKKGQMITEIVASRPLSFSPTADVLLLAEYAPDDDLRQYLLNIGEGEMTKEGSRLSYVFGGRYLNNATWSSDGKTITLHYIKLLSEVGSETFEVEQLLEN